MSESEEMYLISIARLKEDGLQGPVPLSRLAADLSIVSVSVNQMVKKLAAAGFVRYQPYKGVSLTPEGQKQAMKILRHRRLWEYFLVEHLGIPAQEADALACRMEHITSSPIADRLAAYLDNPPTTPDGKLIPDNEDHQSRPNHIPLSDLAIEQRGYVEFIDAHGSVSQFLESQGIYKGVEIGVLARGASGSLLLDVLGEQISVSADVARSIRVQAVMPGTPTDKNQPNQEFEKA